MSQRRKERRILCTKCSKSYTSRWIKQHQCVSIINAQNIFKPIQQNGNDRLEENQLDIPAHVESIFQNSLQSNMLEESENSENDALENLDDSEGNDDDTFQSRSEESENSENDALENVDDCEGNNDDTFESSSDIFMDVGNNSGSEISELDDDSINDDSEEDNFQENTENLYTNASPLFQIQKWIAMFFNFWQTKYNIPSNAMSVLLQFIWVLLKILCCTGTQFVKLPGIFPRTVYRLHTNLIENKNKFKRYVVCRKCFTLYEYEDCIKRFAGQTISKKCQYVEFPHHPHRSRRKSCGMELLTVDSRNGKERINANLIYPYKSIKESIKEFMSRKGFFKLCEKWRNRTIPDTILADIYDGAVWKEWSEERQFLSYPGNLAVMLNVDWFRTFKHSYGSLGIIYLAVLNLPRDIRFHLENVIVVGIIPGPKEPNLTCNTFIEPMVLELKELWSGVYMDIEDHKRKLKVRAALLLVCCDIPATRKIGGFMAHNANQGCPYCKKNFREAGAGFNAQPNCSGFDRDEWTPRENVEHRNHAAQWLQHNTMKDKEAHCSKYGARYSTLHQLSYFDSIRYFAVDPMHGLFLGTAKRMANRWVSEGILTSDMLNSIQSRMDKAEPPSDLGRIPYKVSINFSGFKADEWRLWTLVYSSFALHGILPVEHYQCWQLFVIACTHYSRRILTKNGLKIADAFLIRFCKEVQRLYGEEFVTPNMHLHGHLNKSCLDYGPIYSFWLFAYERFNFNLGHYPTNGRSVHLQIMTRVLQDKYARNPDFPDLFNEEFSSFFDMHNKRALISEEHNCEELTKLAFIQVRSDIDKIDWTILHGVKLLGKETDDCLDPIDHQFLKDTYDILYPTGVENIPLTIAKYLRIDLNGDRIGTEGTRSQRSSFISAKWTGLGGYIDTQSEARPGQVIGFFQHNVLVNGFDIKHTFARVRWFTEHPEKESLGKTVSIWSKTYEPFGSASFLPITRIASRCMTVEYECAYGEIVYAVVNLPRRWSC